MAVTTQISYAEQCRIAAKIKRKTMAKRTRFTEEYIRQMERLAARWAAGEAVSLPSHNAMDRYSRAIGRGIEIFFTKGEQAEKAV